MKARPAEPAEPPSAMKRPAEPAEPPPPGLRLSKGDDAKDGTSRCDGKSWAWDQHDWTRKEAAAPQAQARQAQQAEEQAADLTVKNGHGFGDN